MKKDKPKNKKPSLRAVALIVACAVIWLIIIYQTFTSRLNRTQLWIPFGFGAAEVLSGSMEPTFSQGDMIFIVKASSYEVDDIVVFNSGEGFVVHRITAMEGDSVITRGDANNAPDEPIEKADIEAKMVFFVPKLGRIARMAKTPLILISIIVSILSMIKRRTDVGADEELEKQRLLLEEIEKLKKETDK